MLRGKIQPGGDDCDSSGVATTGGAAERRTHLVDSRQAIQKPHDRIVAVLGAQSTPDNGGPPRFTIAIDENMPRDDKQIACRRLARIDPSLGDGIRHSGYRFVSGFLPIDVIEIGVGSDQEVKKTLPNQ
ncbi:hypothetical protein Caci_3855 [Catenulispora acidiphila DSM 44928]|uniref:Uncharacterized protein n=1 Tax=Catenulispora acidiphila (strain DSM 44928 / JCM 14897 / NBRC 102108 / NRRL B-24433 / ID139908) TaxID=479433 RepID=C7QDF7_CATAD|nr:hypothetical protein [Catenulispora acidiphila]ACU72750.1 hypothetical protein Caci_3855 [Catenulispora acidiphila DSM 44928]